MCRSSVVNKYTDKIIITSRHVRVSHLLMSSCTVFATFVVSVLLQNHVLNFLFLVIGALQMS